MWVSNPESEYVKTLVKLVKGSVIFEKYLENFVVLEIIHGSDGNDYTLF